MPLLFEIFLAVLLGSVGLMCLKSMVITVTPSCVHDWSVSLQNDPGTSFEDEYCWKCKATRHVVTA